MHRLRALSSFWIGVGIALFLAAGCADGPFSELASWNPWVRKEWDEDEEYGPTFHKRFAELNSLRTRGEQLSSAEQERLAPQLLALVQNEINPILRAEAVGAMGRFSTPAVLPGLRLAVTDADPEVRKAACRSWGNRGGVEAAQVLGETLARDKDIDVRITATSELGRFSDQAAVQALGLALNDNDPALQFQAVKSLESATGRDFGDSVPAWRDFVAGRTPQPAPPVSVVERLRRLF